MAKVEGGGGGGDMIGGVQEIERDDDYIRSLERSLSAVQDEAERFRAELRKVTSTVKPDKKVHEPLLDDTAFIYCNALQEFRLPSSLSSSSSREQQDPDPYVKKWGETLAQIRQIYNQMVGLQHVLIGGLDTWATDPTYAIGEEKKALDESKSAYEAALKRWRSKSTRPNADGVPALEAKLGTARREYESALKNYTSRLSAIVSHMKAEFYDRLTSAMFSAESFFNAGGELMNAMQPLMLEKRVLLEKSRLEEINRVTNVEDQPPAPPLSAPSDTDRHNPHHNPAPSPSSSAVGPLSASPAPAQNPNQSLVLKEGPLLLKKSRGLKNWHPYHFEVRSDGVLYWYKPKDKKESGQDEDKARKLGQFIHLMLATAKPMADSKYEHCFEVITPTRASIQLRASSAEDRTAWMECFRRVVSEGLAKSSFAPSETQKSNDRPLPVLNLNATAGANAGTSPPAAFSGATSLGARSGAELAQSLAQAEGTLERLLGNVAHEGLRAVVSQADNRKCADCNSPTPEWASINLGLLMCTECSGVHRSMGTHISKVRSLTLDKWETVDVQILAAIGNEKANKFWEYGVVAQNGRKPAPNGPNLLKQMFINCKYVERVWIPHSTQPLAADMLFQKLFWGIATSDLVTCSRIIALGAEVNAHTNPDGKTLLHGSAEEGNALCLEFLLLNGGDAMAKDDDGRLPLHYAAGRGDPDCIRLLVLRMSDAALNEKDSEGFTARDFMLENGHSDLLPLLTTNPQLLNSAANAIIAQRKATAAAAAYSSSKESQSNMQTSQSIPPIPVSITVSGGSTTSNPFARKNPPPTAPYPPVSNNSSYLVPQQPSASVSSSTTPSMIMSSRESRPIKLPGGGDQDSRSKIIRGSRLQSVQLYRPSNPGAVNITPLRQSSARGVFPEGGSTVSHSAPTSVANNSGSVVLNQPQPQHQSFVASVPLAVPSGAPLEYGSSPISPAASRPPPTVMSLRAHSPAQQSAVASSSSAALASITAAANSVSISPQRKASTSSPSANVSVGPPLPTPLLSPKTASPPPRPFPSSAPPPRP